MKVSKWIFFLVILLALPGSPVFGFAADEPVNQCIMLPEVVAGPSASNDYQPESCITLKMDNHTDYVAYAGNWQAHDLGK